MSRTACYGAPHGLSPRDPVDSLTSGNRGGAELQRRIVD